LGDCTIEINVVPDFRKLAGLTKFGSDGTGAASRMTCMNYTLDFVAGHHDRPWRIHRGDGSLVFALLSSDASMAHTILSRLNARRVARLSSTRKEVAVFEIHELAVTSQRT
jgi:hypothetical protein